MVHIRKQSRRTRRSARYSSHEHYDFQFEKLEPRSMLAAGILDPTFGFGGKVTTDFFGLTDIVQEIAVQADGKIVAAGAAFNGTNDDFALIRYNIDGSLDTSFGVGGRVTTDFGGHDDLADGIAIQSDGRIVLGGFTTLGGRDSSFALARYNTDGNLDSSFGIGGKVTTDFGRAEDAIRSIAIQTDDRIIAVGVASDLVCCGADWALARYNLDGSLDNTFGVGGKVTTSFTSNAEDAHAVTLQVDGKIVVAGSVDFVGFALARYNTDGSLDLGFGVGGQLTTGFGDRVDRAHSVAIQADGKILAAGFTRTGGFRVALVRYESNGTLDASFGVGGIVFTDITTGPGADFATDVLIRSDGKIVASGTAGQDNFAVVLYNGDGSLDASFGTFGIVTTDFAGDIDIAHSVAIQLDGKIVVAGLAYVNGNYDFALARYGGDVQQTTISGLIYNDTNNDGQVDFGEDGVAGISVTLVGTDISNNSVNTSIMSLADGSFIFDGVLPGTYSLTSDHPIGFLDGRETAGNEGGTVNNSIDNKTITGIVIGNDGVAAIDYFFGNIRPAEISGLVWEDFNVDSEVNFSEHAIDNALVTLTGTDDRGTATNMDFYTDSDGAYMFFDLRPGTYNLIETQPTEFNDSAEVLGTINGVPVGNIIGNDQFASLVLGTGAVGINYNFAERPLNGGNVSPGQTATIGFWQNNNGRALVLSLNGGETSMQLSTWLAQTFPNMYGSAAGANNLSGKTNTQVWDFYNALFRRKQKEAQALGLSGPAKVDAQVFATALAVYVTNQTLAGSTASGYGFVVTQNGLGASTFNVGSSGQAFGVANNSSVSVLDLLLAVNARSHNGRLYDLDDDGDANDSTETVLRTKANNIFSAINEQGDI